MNEKIEDDFEHYFNATQRLSAELKEVNAERDEWHALATRLERALREEQAGHYTAEQRLHEAVDALAMAAAPLEVLYKQPPTIRIGWLRRKEFVHSPTLRRGIEEAVLEIRRFLGRYLASSQPMKAE